ncbi:hypothetical protein EB796_023527 [Bugula neritina]|uniref:C2H2-type domain-containing protein n=1 Tax=Bugula neritina TaxID=10212 RepID=A0A7J7IW89_BUGNE|nr:hypothetical protein EB796_023527 [Bugula neritina]
MDAEIFLAEKLQPHNLKMLYPTNNFYQNKLNLTNHLIETLLVEEMEWEGNAAMGETAFWLKILSVPATAELRRMKLDFKRKVYKIWNESLSCKLQKDVGDKKTPTNIESPEEAPQEHQSLTNHFQSNVPDLGNSPDRQQVKVINPEGGEKIIEIQPAEVINFEDLEMSTNESESQQAAAAICDISLDADSTSSVVATPLPRMHCSTEKPIPAKRKSHLVEADVEKLKLMKCSHCSFTGVTLNDVAVHKFSAHQDIYVVPCPYPNCHYRARQKNIIRVHIESRHTKGKRFKCSLCDASFKTLMVAKKHYRSRHENEKLTCELCDFQCDIFKQKLKNMHMAEAHNDMSKVFKCQDCEFYGSSRSILAAHIHAKHTASYDSKVAYHCGKGLCEYANFIEEFVIQHRRHCDGRAKHLRLVCKKKKPIKNRKRTHLINKFWCSVCGGLFVTKYSVETHIAKLHDNQGHPVPTNSDKPGEMEFKCSVCGKLSADKQTIDKHITEVHAESGECVGTYLEDKNYVPELIRCKYCDFTSKLLCAMKSHVRARHTHAIYKCDVCDFTTNSKNGIATHKTSAHLKKALRVKISVNNKPSAASTDIVPLSQPNGVIHDDLSQSGNESVAHGNLPVAHRNLPVAHGNLPVAHGNLPLAPENLPVAIEEVDSEDIVVVGQSIAASNMDTTMFVDGSSEFPVESEVTIS